MQSFEDAWEHLANNPVWTATPEALSIQVRHFAKLLLPAFHQSPHDLFYFGDWHHKFTVHFYLPPM